MKPDGSLRLFLDPKDLNKAIERNQWYSRTIDDILPELANSKYKTLKDATSGYWHVLLDLASSLMAIFNTPWGKFRWLHLPFGLQIASDVFQERLDRVLQLLKGVHGIADDILTHGTTETEHDGRLLMSHTNKYSVVHGVVKALYCCTGYKLQVKARHYGGAL